MHNLKKCCVKDCLNKALASDLYCPACSDKHYFAEARDIAIITGKPPVPSTAEFMSAMEKENMTKFIEAKQAVMDANFKADLDIRQLHMDNLKIQQSLSYKYPKYYKAIPEGMKEIDVYGVHRLFNIQDPSGAIQHASKKLLLSGIRTGGKSMYQDIKEARDTLNRWLELHPET